MRNLRIYSVSSFHLYHTAKLSVFTMLYIILLVFIYLITRSLYLLDIFLHFPPPQTLPLVTRNLFHFYIILFICFPHSGEIIQSLSLSYFTQYIVYNIYSCCHKWQNFLLFMAEQHSIVCIQPQCLFSTYLSMDTKEVSTSWLQ